MMLQRFTRTARFNIKHFWGIWIEDGKFMRTFYNLGKSTAVIFSGKSFSARSSIVPSYGSASMMMLSTFVVWQNPEEMCCVIA
jgi:hypothetical protein